MTASEMYKILAEVDRRLDRQDKRIADLQAEIQRLYARLTQR
jgi:uncharacterized small protein (DUF1192 family)